MRRYLLDTLMALTTCSMMAQVELGDKVEVGKPSDITVFVYDNNTQKVENGEDLIGSDDYWNVVADRLGIIGITKDSDKIEDVLSEVIGDGYWTVISDRSNNNTYTEPDSNSPIYKTLDFNEVLKIAKVSNGYALVYKDVKGTVFPSVTEKAESFGWIPLTNLLLWTKCPMTDSNIYRKALVAINLDNLGDQSLVRLNPNSSSGKEIASNKIYFPMKETTDPKGNKLVLLSETSSLDGENSQSLVGWIDESNVSRWDNRVYMERNLNTKPSSQNNISTDVDQPVLFISDRESQPLRNVLSFLNIYYSSEDIEHDERFSMLSNKIPDLIKGLIRDSESKNEAIKSMSVGEIVAEILGANVKCDFEGSQYTLDELKDRNIVSKEQFSEVMKFFRTLGTRFEDIMRNSEDKELIGDEYFYRIPLNALI